MVEGVTAKKWAKTKIQNLVRHKSGVYYARLYHGGKEQWKSLRTSLLEVAKSRLREFAGEVGETAAARDAQTLGKMTFGQAAALFVERLQASGLGLQGKRKNRKRITPSSIHYREQTVKSLLRSWPGLAETDVRKISEADCERWAETFSGSISATRFNGTLDTLRHVFRLAIQAGARHGNPADAVGRCEVKQKELRLPERGQFTNFVKAIETAGAWCSRDCADFVQFLAFTGSRKNEAANVMWGDVDFERGRVHLRVTKNDKPRFVPMIPEARALLERMRNARPAALPGEPILRVQEAQKAIDHAAEKVGISRITHHDLRHLFATTCIEAGIDIPTVSRWLGHVDGGALAMKTYGHLRDEHSMSQAKKVSFAPAASESDDTPPTQKTWTERSHLRGTGNARSK